MAMLQVEPQPTGPDAPPAPGSDQRPEWLPEKFKSPEDLAKSYIELERKMGQGGAPDLGTGDKAPPAPSPDATPPTPEEPRGMDISKYESEYRETGALSEESFAALAAAGIPKTTVDAYIAGQEAKAEQIRQSVYSEVGGQDQYSAMLQWAAQRLSPQEIEAYDRTTSTDDVNALKLAARGLYARFVAENGKAPRLQTGGTGISAGSAGFQSFRQMTEAMKDPRYTKDPAFRAEVEERIKNSPSLYRK